MSVLESLLSKELAAGVLTAGVTAYLAKLVLGSPRKCLPPGPRWFPIIGHLLSMPRSLEHIAYAEMARGLNSDIIALTVVGQVIIVLNSAEATSELLDRRSAIYSGRAQIAVVSDKDLMDWGQGVAFLNNNDRWRRDRRMLHGALHKGVIPRYHTILEKHARCLLMRLVDAPSTVESFTAQLSFTLGAGIMHVVYGYTPKSPDDDWLRSAREATENIAQAAQPTTFMVNFIPALKSLPDWIPGTGWKRVVKKWREHKEYIVSAPYEWAKGQIKNGGAVSSVVHDILSMFPDLTLSTEDELHTKLMSATMIGGSLDTTTASIMFFLLAMVIYPEVGLKLQAEVDKVLGYAERLPNSQDQKHMPYVRNTILELLRWQPATPLAVPHAAMEDDEYKGYHIPKGAIVMGNTWAITRNESIYPDPERFNPDRFLNPDVPAAPAFGACPGAHLAEANLFLLISSLVCVFDIRRAIDETGKEIVPEAKIGLDSTLVCKPLPFEFIMRPRSEAHRELAMEYLG